MDTDGVAIILHVMTCMHTYMWHADTCTWPMPNFQCTRHTEREREGERETKREGEREYTTKSVKWQINLQPLLSIYLLHGLSRNNYRKH